MGVSVAVRPPDGCRPNYGPLRGLLPFSVHRPRWGRLPGGEPPGRRCCLVLRLLLALLADLAVHVRGSGDSRAISPMLRAGGVVHDP